MKKQQGFTLIELLVVIGIMALLSTLAVVSFGSARVKARDAKRTSDVRALISAFAASSQDNASNTLCSGATPMGSTATAKQVSTLTINDKTDCTGTNVTSNYINLSNVKDPVNTNVCAAIPPAAPCDYTVAANGTLSAFTIGFTTEGNAVQGLAAGLNHTANQSGIVN